MKKKPIFLLFLFACSLFISSGCSEQDRDIRDYYFPVRALAQGMVYEYEVLAGVDSLPIYWYALGIDKDTALYLAITTYGSDLSPSSLVREQLFKEGVLTQDVSVYTTDSTGHSQESQAEIIAANAFPFYLPKAGEAPAYVYRIRYKSPASDSVVYTLTYNRQYDKDTTVEILGQKLAAIRFHIAGETDIYDPLNGSLSPRFEGYEVYAKGVGLVESYRNFDGFVLHNRLRARLGMEEFEAIAKSRTRWNLAEE